MVADQFNARITLFNNLGTVVDTLSFAGTNILWPRSAAILSGNRFLLGYRLPPEVRGSHDDHLFHVFSSEAIEVDSFGSPAELPDGVFADLFSAVDLGTTALAEDGIFYFAPAAFAGMIAAYGSPTGRWKKLRSVRSRMGERESIIELAGADRKDGPGVVGISGLNAGWGKITLYSVGMVARRRTLVHFFAAAETERWKYFAEEHDLDTGQSDITYFPHLSDEKVEYGVPRMRLYGDSEPGVVLFVDQVSQTIQGFRWTKRLVQNDATANQ